MRLSTAAMAVMLASVAACAEPLPRPVDADDGWGPSLPGPSAPAPLPDAPRPRAIDPAARQRWERADEIGTLTAVAGRGRSDHLDGSFARSVLINEAAAGYLVTGAPNEPFPEGALIVQAHIGAGSGLPGPYFAMLKGAAGSAPAQRDWEFLVLDAKLRVAARGSIEPCARCHLEAPRDAVFGPSTDAQP